MAMLDLFRRSLGFLTMPAGEVVFRAGDARGGAFVVQSGEVEIRVRDRPVEVVGPGGIFGEMALIDDQPRSATAVCLSETKLVPIDEKRFLFLVQQTPNFALEIMKVMASRLRRMDAGE